jgi:CubicO group peptidase (beta-lactamase class C family)
VGPLVTPGKDPVSVDTPYRIMSMTKVVATTVAL